MQHTFVSETQVSTGITIIVFCYLFALILTVVSHDSLEWPCDHLSGNCSLLSIYNSDAMLLEGGSHCRKALIMYIHFSLLHFTLCTSEMFSSFLCSSFFASFCFRVNLIFLLTLWLASMRHSKSFQHIPAVPPHPIYHSPGASNPLLLHHSSVTSRLFTVGMLGCTSASVLI